MIKRIHIGLLFMLPVFCHNTVLGKISSELANTYGGTSRLYNDTLLQHARNIWVQTHSKAPLCLVFCDFTNSIDSASRRKICSDANNILNKLYNKEKIQFYQIDNKEFSAPFFRTDPVSENVTGLRPSEMRQLKEQITMEKAGLQTTINTIFTISKLKETCIINGISKAIREFKNYDQTGNTPLRLIFLSDMLECCINAHGKINLEDGSFDEDIKTLKKFPVPRLSLQPFKNLKIGFAVSNTKSIRDPDGFHEFWKIVFQRYGYKIDELIEQLNLN